MNKFIKIFTMFFLITFSSTLYADAPGPVNLSLKGIVDWVRFFQFVEYGTALPSTPSTRGVWFILWVNNEPALYWSNGSEWIPFVTAGVQDGSVDTDALADGAVTTPKLADSSVSTNKIVNYAVTTNKIADNAVTGTKFANNSITTAKLAPYAVTNEKLGYLSVGTLNLQNGAVTSDKMESTFSDKNIVLNNGTVLNPSLSFHSDRFSGLSYDSASSTIDVSIGASDKIKIGSSFINFNNMIDGLTISSASERIVLQSNGLHHDDISLVFNNDILASGSLLPSENLTFNLGSSTNKWNEIFVNRINIDSIDNDNHYFISTNIIPETDNTGYIGSDTLRWNIIHSVNASHTVMDSDLVNVTNASVTSLLTSPYIISQTVSSDNLLATDSNIQNLEIVNSIYPSVDNSVEVGTATLKIKSGDFYNLNIDDLNVVNASFTNIQSDYILVDNASVTYALNASTIIASETIETDYLMADTASFTNLNVDNDTVVNNNLEVKGIASVTSLLVNGAPLSGAENLKFPRGTLSVDVDCGKYSLRSLGKDLVLFSDSWSMLDYNFTEYNGSYFTFNTSASPAVMLMDTPIDLLSLLTIRLDYEGIDIDSSLQYLISIQNTNGDFVTSFYSNNGRFYISFFNGNETLIDFDATSYDWNDEKNIYLTLNFSETGYVNWKMNIDGVDVYSQKTSVSANTNGYININSIHVGDGNNGTYSISKSWFTHYRRIQIYPYALSLKEKISIPLFQPVADQQRELSKNTTRCPYYTLGEPSTLIGGDFNEGEGFFGEVTGDKFIYPWEVLGQLWGMDMNVIDTKAKFIASFTEVFGSNISYTFTGDSYTALGVSDNLEVEWLKFYDNGYLIFIPKRPLLNNITWNEINNALGGYEGKEVQIPVNRINPIQTYTNKKSVGLVCRMINGGNLQPVIIGNINERGLENNNLCMGSEWNRLMYRICDQIPSDTFSGSVQGYSGGKQFGDNWYNYTGSILGFGASNDLGRVTWCREYCWYQNALHCCTRSNVSGVGFVTYATPSSRFTYYGFRPALVLKVCNQ